MIKDDCANMKVLVKKRDVRSGIRTHAYMSRLRPERSALDRSAILTTRLMKAVISTLLELRVRALIPEKRFHFFNRCEKILQGH